jgi:microcystin degradation protein MlrC
MVRLPLLVGGEAAVTEVEPARSLYARLGDLDRIPGIICSSILIGCAWTDSPFATVSVVLSGTDAAAMRREASSLAAEIWRRRAQFRIDSPTAEPEEAIRQALSLPIRPVFISDSGDNPTAGAAGDSPLMLELLVRRRAPGALVAGLADPEAVSRCFAAGIGATAELHLGGKLDAVFARPYACSARVVRLVEAASSQGRRALVETGGVHVVLQTRRRPFTELADFSSMDIVPGRYQVIVVKLGYLFPELRDYAPHHIMALTPGFGDQRLDRLPYRHLSRPVYPLEASTQWDPEKEST